MGHKGVNFKPERDIPSLAGKTILVTGGNSGLGKESIINFARHGPKEIWLGARSKERAQQAIADIQRLVPGAPPIHILQMDCNSLSSMRAAAETFRAKSDRLDILLLNAGIMSVPEGLTNDGYEIQFGTNHMSHAMLTKMLLPTLLHTAELPGADVRVVTVSSSAHQYAPSDKGILFDTLKTTAPRISSATRYGQSKLANVLFAQELARRYPKITSVSLHPGLVKTNLANTMSENSMFMRIAWAMAEVTIGVDVHTGALNQSWACTMPGVKSGEYYVPIGKTGAGTDWTKAPKAPKLAKELWDWTENELDRKLETL